MLNKVHGSVELEKELRLAEGLLAKTLNDLDKRVDMDLFDDRSILELNDFRFRQPNRDHVFDTELGEGLIVEQSLGDLTINTPLKGVVNLEHQCELKNINIVNRPKLKIIERSEISDTVVVRRTLGAKFSTIEVSFADGCRDGQTCKAEKGEQFDKAGMHFRSWLADLYGQLTSKK